jgi:hypothetical protein
MGHVRRGIRMLKAAAVSCGSPRPGESLRKHCVELLQAEGMVWKTMHDYPPETLRVVCCGIVNRGAAIYEGMIIRARFENSVLNGKNQMPPWKGVLSDEEIDQVWYYIRAHANQK